MRYVLFRLEKDRYALPLGAVREVLVPPESLSRVPRAPPGVHGVMNLRGRVVTVLELGPLLGLPPVGVGLGKLVLLDRGRRDIGLLVSEVEGIEPIEKVTPAPGAASASIAGVARLGARAVTVLDPDGLDGALTQLFDRGAHAA